MNAPTLAVHRAIVCVDVEGFGDRRRTNPHQVLVRKGLYRCLRTAFTRSGISWQDCYHEDRGDGLLLLVQSEVPKNLLVTNVPQELAAALAEHNRAACDPQISIRLRMAVHAGEIHHDDHGVAGSAINFAFRLLEAEPLKKALANSVGALVLIASQWFFEEVIRHSPAGHPEAYRRVRIAVKETMADAWVHRPDDPYPSDGRSSKAITAAGEWPVPQQLPAAASVFVGRQADMAALDAMLTGDGAYEAVVISAIAGGAGVGKTTLAVQWAHQAKENFPDGTLFVNLRGYDSGEPVSPSDALDGFLRALNVPTNKIPFDPQLRAALFRSMLAGRRMLVVLDNAATAEQVRPLLPGVPGCSALITSRSRLSGLAARDGAQRLPLDVLSADQAVRLLRQIVGAERVAAEPDKARELAQRCAYLPLALRIAADRAISSPHLMLRDLVDELADERERLDALATGGDEATTVRAVFRWSYCTLPDAAAQAFRLLGLHPGPDIALDAAAALLGLSIGQARSVLEILVDQHLLEHSRRGRYRFHDLLRVYAAECAGQDEGKFTRDDADSRLLNWYLHTANAANATVLPHGYQIRLDRENTTGPPPLQFTGENQALEWFERERTNLVAAIQYAVDLGRDHIAWRLAATLIPFFNVQWFPTDLLAALQLGRAAAQRLNNSGATALMLLYQGDRSRQFGRYGEAIEFYKRALSAARDANDRWIEGFCHNSFGLTTTDLGEFDTAVEHLQHALLVFREISDRRGEGIALSNLGEAFNALGQLESAIDCNRQAMTIFTDTGNRSSLAATLRRIGDVYRKREQLDEAVYYYQEAIAILRGTGYRTQFAKTLVCLGELYLAVGQADRGRHCLRGALELFGGLFHPRATAARDLLVAANTRERSEYD
jgi:tetratricopeptide (TPR) repeat protein